MGSRQGHLSDWEKRSSLLAVRHIVRSIFVTDGDFDFVLFDLKCVAHIRDGSDASYHWRPSIRMLVTGRCTAILTPPQALWCTGYLPLMCPSLDFAQANNV